MEEAVKWLFSELLKPKVYTRSTGRTLIDFRSGYNANVELWNMMQEDGYEAGDYMKQMIKTRPNIWCRGRGCQRDGESDDSAYRTV